MRMMLKQVALVGVVALVASACATRGFARREAAAVDAKVDTLAATVEETQERTLQNEEQIGVVDQRAQAAGQAAEMGQQAADAAVQAAEAVDMRVDGVEEEARRFMFEVTLNEPQGNFELGRTDLSGCRARPDRSAGGPDPGRPPERVLRDRGAHGLDRFGAPQHAARHAARRYGEDVPVRPAQRAAAQNQRAELRRGSPGGTERHRGRAGAEPPRRDPGPVVASRGGVGPRQRPEALLHESERARTDPDPQLLHRPMRYDIGLPSPVIQFRISQPRSASLPCPAGLRARRPSPMRDL